MIAYDIFEETSLYQVERFLTEAQNISNRAVKTRLVYKLLAATKEHSASAVRSMYATVKQVLDTEYISQRQFDQLLEKHHAHFQSRDGQIKSGAIHLLPDQKIVDVLQKRLVYDPSAQGVHTEDLQTLIESVYSAEFICPDKAKIMRTLNEVQLLPQCERKLITINGRKLRGLTKCRIIEEKNPIRKEETHEEKPIQQRENAEKQMAYHIERFRKSVGNENFIETLTEVKRIERTLYQGPVPRENKNLQLEHEGVKLYDQKTALYSLQFVRFIFQQILDRKNTLKIQFKEENINSTNCNSVYPFLLEMDAQSVPQKNTGRCINTA